MIYLDHVSKNSDNINGVPSDNINGVPILVVVSLHFYSLNKQIINLTLSSSFA